MTILPINFIEDICISTGGSTDIYKKFYQVENLGIDVIDPTNGSVFTDNKSGIVRWFLKESSYHFMVENNIKVNLLMSIDISKYPTKFESKIVLPEPPDDRSNHVEVMKFLKKAEKIYNLLKMDVLDQKYKSFPLRCDISDEMLTMMSLTC